MKKLFNLTMALRFSAVLTALLMLAGTVSWAEAQTRRRPVLRKKTTVVRKAAPVKPRVTYYTVAAGERIRVRMEDTLDSKTARVGDTFTTRVVDPVYSTNGAVVIPEGSRIIGRVNTVTAARKGGKPGSIDVSFNSVQLPNGTRRAINGYLADLDTKDGKSDNEGSVSGDKTKNRKLIFIGGSAAGGTVLGAAVGGGKGALIGAIIGGIGGAIAENQTKGENVEVKSGTEFGVVLNQAVSMPKYAEINQ